MNEDKKKALESAIASIEKQHGKGAVMIMGESNIGKVEALSSGCLAIDKAIGIGGYPKGRIVEIFGPESCIYKDSHVDYEVRNASGELIDESGSSIEQLYNKFTNNCDDNVNYDNATFMISSINEKNEIIKQPIADVLKTGIKQCFKLTTKCGYQLVTTAEHKFYTGNDNYKSLGDLKVGDVVFIRRNNNTVEQNTISSIEPVGKLEVYDIKCFAPHNNYIANDIVVHNCGKTTVTLHAIASCQKNGGIAAFIDAEHALDPSYAERIGVNISELVLSQPDSGEQALDIVETLVCSNAVDMVVVDSVAALVPKVELEGEMGDSSIGLQARMLSKAMRKLSGAISKSNCIVIFINQIREKIGVMYGCLHGDTLVNFVDGRNIPIRDVVNNQITGQVWSFNEDTKTFEAKNIIDWHNNGEVSKPEDYLNIKCESDGPIHESFSITVTPDHRVMTKDGWKESKDLRMVDSILSKNFLGLTFVPIKSIRVATDKEIEGLGKTKYDISVEDNHNYMVGGIDNGLIVHNSPETTTGGRALKFFSSVRIEVRRVEDIKNGTEKTGVRTKAKIVKNKVAPPFKEAIFEINFGTGISEAADILEIALDKELIVKSGAWFTYGERRWQGKENVKKSIDDEPDLKEELIVKINEVSL